MRKQAKEMYEIQVFNLKNQEYSYQYKIDKEFFLLFEDSLIENGLCEVSINLVKSETMINLEFKIQGQIELECDRSLEKFDYPINAVRRLILKFGQEEEELSDELAIISKDRHSIDMSQYLYEFIGLEVPMKKLHPRYSDDEENENLLLYSTEDKEEEKTENEEIDPRWLKLKNL